MAFMANYVGSENRTVTMNPVSPTQHKYEIGEHINQFPRIVPLNSNLPWITGPLHYISWYLLILKDQQANVQVLGTWRRTGNCDLSEPQVFGSTNNVSAAGYTL